ncbi:pentatricopeptide repeat-containing protein At1g62350 [Phoenix dactylifera]|uniref:Pentatricopeptide repeat-containing protein At1g62350 n=1 Tax=Phoenix dactylifera TaxID=42345 RepID=A0A8B7BH20_PHODC|nr:pentatricopeptide repeat-containing protein At1g62350 [Phoenix dactylifera]
MLRVASGLIRRRATDGLAGTLTLAPAFLLLRDGGSGPGGADILCRRSSSSASSLASSPSLSIWRRKKEMGKEGLFVVQQLKRLASVGGPRLEQFMRSHVSRLLRTDLFAVLAEFQRQDHVFLSMKIYDSVRKEIWYRPDMYFYRDMLMMLARNKNVKETKQVWADLKSEGVHIDQHTYGDIVRAFSDGGLPVLAMEIYDDMRSSPDPPLSLPFRVILKGLIPYPELREKVKQDFLELFPDMIVYDPPEDLFDEQ